MTQIPSHTSIYITGIGATNSNDDLPSLVLTGRSENPIYLVIDMLQHDNDVDKVTSFFGGTEDTTVSRPINSFHFSLPREVFNVAVTFTCNHKVSQIGASFYKWIVRISGGKSIEFIGRIGLVVNQEDQESPNYLTDSFTMSACYLDHPKLFSYILKS